MTEDELQRFRSDHAAVNMIFLGITVGAGLTVGLMSVTATLDSRGQAVAIGAFVALVGCALYFGIQTLRDRKTAADQVRLITERRLE